MRRMVPKESPVKLKTRLDWERVAIFAAMHIFWAVIYLFAAPTLRWLPARTLPWDPVKYVPYAAIFVIPYLSTYIMPFSVLFTVRDQAQFRRLAVMFVTAIIISGIGFVMLPLAWTAPQSPGAGIFNGLARWLYAADQTGNFFPSLHVSMAFLIAFSVGLAKPRWRSIFLSWAILIAVSTLFIKVHYAVDIVGGFLLAFIIWGLFMRQTRRTATN